MSTAFQLRILVVAALLAGAACDDSPVGPVDAAKLAALGVDRDLVLAAAAALRADSAALDCDCMALDTAYAIQPRTIARVMVERAEELLAQAGSRAAGSEAAPRLVRAIRLTRGARQALDAGDIVLAWRRAHYAAQLLEAAPADARP